MNDLQPPPAPAPPHGPSRGFPGLVPRLIGALFSLSVLAAILLVAGGIAGIVAPGPLAEKTTVIIARGANTRGIAGALAEKKAIYHPVLFRLAARGLAPGGLRAGEYEILPGQSTADIVTMMQEGRAVVHKFTVAEGLTSAEVSKLLNGQTIMTGTLKAVPPEGSLLPETYTYSYGDSRESLVARMRKAMQSTLATLWAERDPAVTLASPEDAVVMASIIEKETGKSAERARIAGVFYNRLRMRMRLQSDPTVIYGIVRAKGSMEHPIVHDDLAFVSPYNTYLIDGLPPKPICNPGEASLAAALHPERNDYLYFVADGTGGHAFAKDLADHDKNIARWRQVREGKLP